ENHTGRDFLRLNDLGIVQTQVKCVGFLVHVQPHNLPFILRSKNTLTTRFGSTVLFTVTRSTRPPTQGFGENTFGPSRHSGPAESPQAPPPYAGPIRLESRVQPWLYPHAWSVEISFHTRSLPKHFAIVPPDLCLHRKPLTMHE